jgi:hypothetical protein
MLSEAATDSSRSFVWRPRRSPAERLFISFCGWCVKNKTGTIINVKRYWEIIADNLSKAGWSWGCIAAIDSRGRTIWIA